MFRVLVGECARCPRLLSVANNVIDRERRFGLVIGMILACDHGQRARRFARVVDGRSVVTRLGIVTNVVIVRAVSIASLVVLVVELVIFKLLQIAIVSNKRIATLEHLRLCILLLCRFEPFSSSQKATIFEHGSAS